MSNRPFAVASVLAVLLLSCAVAAYAVPELGEIADQTIREGLLFAPVPLAELVSDPEYSFDELTWSYSGAVELQTLPYLDRLMIRIPDNEWSGSETIRFEVCSPVGECVSQEATFTVLAVNDSPVLERVPDQVVAPDDPFEPISLVDYVTDVDHEPEELEWSVEGHSELTISLDGGLLTVTAPSADWSGAETLRVRVCDPAGDCAMGTVLFARADANSVVITHVENAGFVIEAGGARVLIDALLFQGVSGEVQEAMRDAVPPFDVDLILITHGHSDHFSAPIVAEHLASNRDAIVVSTPGVIDRIAQAAPEIDARRLIAVDLAEGESKIVEAGGIEISVYEIPHGPGIENIGFLLRLGVWSVFHPGDVMDTLAREVFENHALVEEGIDVAFVPWFLMTNPVLHVALTDGLQAGLYVPMHITSGFARTCEAAIAAFENTLCFNGPMDVWVGFPDD